MAFVLPDRSKVGVLDPEIAGEGMKVIMSDGEQAEYTVPPPKPIVPDWSGIKSLARYFNRTTRQIYPAWLYHPSEPARLVKNENEAAELGVCYRKAQPEEFARYGQQWVWDWRDDSQWRPKPHSIAKFDPSRPDSGKNVIIMPQSASSEKAQLVSELVPAVAAAVAQALKASGQAVAPAGVDTAQWDEFLKFQAWQKSQQAVEAVADATEAPDFEETDDQPSPQTNALNTKPDDRDALIAEAQQKGVTVDKRWGIDRLKSELAKVA